MRRGAISWLIGFCFVLLVIVGGYFVRVRLLPIGCKSIPIQSVTSPDGTSKALIFQRDCGATSAFNIHISLLPVAASPGEEVGNLFVADTDNGKAPAARSGGPEVEVKWLGPKRLKIVYDHRARTFKKVKALGDVEVIYQAK